jgi:transketolase
VRNAMRFAADGRRNAADLHDPSSFDHVGRDAGADFPAGRVLADLADRDPRIVVGCADLTYVTQLGQFGSRHPDRFLYYGISERNMLGSAAGLATTGLIPYVCTFACFSGILGYENIRTGLAYPRLKVRVLGTHAGISMGFFGTSHHATEDLAALRAVAGLTVMSPCDKVSTAALLTATVDLEGPVYFRIGRGREDRAYSDGTQLILDHPTFLRSGTDLLILSTGVMVQECLAAADALAGSGISVSVADVHTIKPFPSGWVAQQAADHAAVLVVEEHNIEGGLGTMTVEALAAAGVRTPVHKHGLRDEFAIIGPPSHLYRYYGLEPVGIAAIATRLLDLPSPPPLVAGPLWTAEDRQAVLARYRQPADRATA